MNVSHNIGDLNQALALYQTFSRKSAEDVIQKQAGKLAFNIKQAMRGIVRPKGSIRSELLARLSAGKGISIRPAVKEAVKAKRESRKLTPSGKVRRFKLNLRQEMVRREIAVRESGRGVLSVSSRYPSVIRQTSVATGKGKQVLSAVGVKTGQEGGFARFVWGESGTTSERLAAAMGGGKPRTALNQALIATRDDIMKYVREKQAKLAAQTVKSLVRQGALQPA